MESAALPGTGSGVLDELAGVIGLQAAFALAWEFRGERVYIPKDPAREPRLAAALGAEQTARLCDVFGGTLVSVPSRAVTERKVAELAAAGMKKREIARTCCIREARVYSILKAQRDSAAATAQLPLL